MVKTDTELRIYISDLTPEAQAEVLKLFNVSAYDKNISDVINCKPICIIPKCAS